MLSNAPIWMLLGLFIAAAVVILFSGLRMTDVADRIADRTGLGEALVGGVLLGAATSLSGTIVSITSALDGRVSLAFSNGVGGIAAQTAFLALADLMHRRANLEHAAAEITNILQGVLLLLMLALPVLAYSAPDVTFWGVHPVSFVLVAIYFAGLKAVRAAQEGPMWEPVRTDETEEDVPDEPEAEAGASKSLFVGFGLLMLVMGVAGWLIAQVAGEVIDRFGVSASLVGALFTAVVTSLPELVTTLAAVRRGALQLAVGGIIGGNTFDVLFLTISDVSYREGSLYHAAGSADYFWLSIGMIMTAVLTLGMLIRQKDGPGGIGVESAAILAIYVGAIAVQAVM
ncbi:sodium:calcium antiporter [Amaricoccus macauensis]|uniref:sodium:calcium antiporter n=1 Tax=Amaricoccus macauensis TaxID=57001 RepID=UPI003C7B0FE5